MRLPEVRRLQLLKLQRISRQLTSRHGASATRASAGLPGRSENVKDTKEGMPGVTIVLPVQGHRTFSLLNWQSQLSMPYAGPVEYIFVAQSASDHAIAALQKLISCDYEAARTRIILSGECQTCSQKIHNLQRGILEASQDSKYVLCLDDDIQLHPGFLQTAVQQLESDPSAFMLTGYPFDIPDPGAGMLSYAALVYHLPLLIGFSLSESTSFVWGGCMLFPLAAMRNDSHGIMQAWNDGGYSDDLIVAAKAAELHLKVLCPSSAVFPQRLEAHYTWSQYWNYLRRQLYVMDTYATASNRRINHSLMIIHSYLSWAVVLPATSGVLRLFLWLAELILLPSQKIWDGPGTSWDWLRIFGADGCHAGVLSSILFWLGAAAAALALSWMTGVMMALFKELSSDGNEVPTCDCFNWLKLWLGCYLNNAILPVCMLYTYFNPWIQWGGVWYAKRRGKVHRLKTTCKLTHL